jgi:hypothetical protein
MGLNSRRKSSGNPNYGWKVRPGRRDSHLRAHGNWSDGGWGPEDVCMHYLFIDALLEIPFG